MQHHYNEYSYYIITIFVSLMDVNSSSKPISSLLFFIFAFFSAIMLHVLAGDVLCLKSDISYDYAEIITGSAVLVSQNRLITVPLPSQTISNDPMEDAVLGSSVKRIEWNQPAVKYLKINYIKLEKHKSDEGMLKHNEFVDCEIRSPRIILTDVYRVVMPFTLTITQYKHGCIIAINIERVNKVDLFLNGRLVLPETVRKREMIYRIVEKIEICVAISGSVIYKYTDL